MTRKSVIAGIVTYNPEINRLVKNIEAIKKQVDKVILVDNCSDNIGELIKIKRKMDITLIDNKINKGIAYALNQIMEYAKENRYEWCVTLDQDSICPKNLVSTASALFNNKTVGQIAPLIYEKNTGETPYLDAKPNNGTFQEVPKCITSASINNVSIWNKIKGFDNNLFIDYVDYDYSIRIRMNGYKIIRMNNVLLNHELGNSKIHRLLFWKVRVANHSAFRKYYICRNIIIYIRRYKKNINVNKELLRLAKVILLTILFEKNKLNKLKMICNGLIDGIKIKI